MSNTGGFGPEICNCLFYMNSLHGTHLGLEKLGQQFAITSSSKLTKNMEGQTVKNALQIPAVNSPNEAKIVNAEVS
jgi:hypothetical protein